MTELNIIPNKWKEGQDSIIANLNLDTNATGFTYLPVRYCTDRKFKLTKEDWIEMNNDIKAGTEKVYLVKQEDAGDQSTIELGSKGRARSASKSPRRNQTKSPQAKKPKRSGTPARVRFASNQPKKQKQSKKGKAGGKK